MDHYPIWYWTINMYIQMILALNFWGICAIENELDILIFNIKMFKFRHLFHNKLSASIGDGDRHMGWIKVTSLVLGK